ncbi:MAG: aspartyl protease family protein, partial [Saprospiraceae bacterium]|nr:aspartyl protease family protein [Saprospiraceae bacterium]
DHWMNAVYSIADSFAGWVERHVFTPGLILVTLFFSYIFLPLLANAGDTNTKDYSASICFPQAIVSNINTVHIPFTLTGRLITIEAQVGDVGGNFFFDTGSERLILNRSYYDPDVSAAIAGMGASGLVDEVESKRVDSIFIDHLSIEDLLAHVIDLSHIEQKKNIQLRGILGYNVFRDFEILVDYPARIITLSRLDNSGQPLENRQVWEQKSDSIHFYLDHHLIVLRAEVAGKKLRFMLDTGAELNLLDRLVGRRVLRQFKILRRVNMSGVGKREVEVLAGLLSGFKCGAQEPEEMHTLLTSLDNLNESFRSSIQGVLGYEFLYDKRILINYKKEKLYFLLPNRP